jgi:hypothetical protein
MAGIPPPHPLTPPFDLRTLVLALIVCESVQVYALFEAAWVDGNL